MRKAMEFKLNNRFETAAVFGLAVIFLFSLCCGPATTTQVVDDGPVDELTEEERAAQKAKDDEAKRKAELAKSLQVRKVVVPPKAEFVPGVEVEAQKEFRDGVISVYQMPPDYDSATSKFEASIDRDKNFMEAYFNLGMVYERKGEGDAALAVYQKALDANPESGSAKAYIGKVYLATARQAYDNGDVAKGGQFEAKAKQLFDEVIVSDPDNVEVNNSLGLYWVMRAMREPDKARRIDAIQTAEDFVQNVLTFQPANVIALNTRGLIYVLKMSSRSPSGYSRTKF